MATPNDLRTSAARGDGGGNDKDPDLRDAILQAAATCFKRDGYAKTTLDDIGHLVGLNKSSLYYYFKNKEALFAAVVLKESEAYIAAGLAEMAAIASPRARIAAYLVKRIRYYADVLAEHRVTPVHLERVEPVFDRLFAEIKTQEIGWVEGWLTELGWPTSECLPFAQNLLLLSNALKHEAMRDARLSKSTDIDFEGAIDQLTYFLDRLLPA